MPSLLAKRRASGTFSQTYGSILTVILHINDDVLCCWSRELLEFNARNQVTLWGPASLISGKNGMGPGSPQDYAGKTWQGLYADFYLPRQQLLFGMLADAARLASDLQQPINFTALGVNFTLASLTLEGAWGNSSNTSLFVQKPEGVTFALASALLTKHGNTVDKQVWCAVRNAGQTSYNTDKAGAIIFWQLQSYMENSTCSFPCMAMPWNQGYNTVLGCE